MPVGPREATSNRAWAPRRTKESHLRLVGFFCCLEGASIDFVNGLLIVSDRWLQFECRFEDYLARSAAGMRMEGGSGLIPRARS
jgi:hypothetical protein